MSYKYSLSVLVTLVGLCVYLSSGAGTVSLRDAALSVIEGETVDVCVEAAMLEDGDSVVVQVTTIAGGSGVPGKCIKQQHGDHCSFLLMPQVQTSQQYLKKKCSHLVTLWRNASMYRQQLILSLSMMRHLL